MAQLAARFSSLFTHVRRQRKTPALDGNDEAEESILRAANWAPKHVSLVRDAAPPIGSRKTASFPPVSHTKSHSKMRVAARGAESVFKGDKGIPSIW